VARLSVYNIEGKEIETIEVPEGLFDAKVSTDVIHQAVLMYQAAERQGNASTKERGSVSGGGKKPWKQKGTGRARAGSIRSPLWTKGGVVFGPHPRDFSYTIPQKVRRAALRESLNAKFQEKDLFCLEDIKKALNKTKEFAKIIVNLGLKGKVLALLDGSDPSIERVSRNLPYFTLMRAQDVNAYDVLRNKKILVSKSAFMSLLNRISVIELPSNKQKEKLNKKEG